VALFKQFNKSCTRTSRHRCVVDSPQQTALSIQIYLVLLLTSSSKTAQQNT